MARPTAPLTVDKMVDVGAGRRLGGDVGAGLLLGAGLPSLPGLPLLIVSYEY